MHEGKKKMEEEGQNASVPVHVKTQACKHTDGGMLHVFTCSETKETENKHNNFELRRQTGQFLQISKDTAYLTWYARLFFMFLDLNSLLFVV